jgi:hypothetical protein
MYSRLLLTQIELYNQLTTFEISLGSLVNTGLISDKDIDVSFTAINTLEEEMKRCQKEYVTLGSFFSLKKMFLFLLLLG